VFDADLRTRFFLDSELTDSSALRGSAAQIMGALTSSSPLVRNPLKRRAGTPHPCCKARTSSTTATACSYAPYSPTRDLPAPPTPAPGFGKSRSSRRRKNKNAQIAKLQQQVNLLTDDLTDLAVNCSVIVNNMLDKPKNVSRVEYTPLKLEDSTECAMIAANISADGDYLNTSLAFNGMVIDI
jgi:hypothetical protein